MWMPEMRVQAASSQVSSALPEFPYFVSIRTIPPQKKKARRGMELSGAFLGSKMIWRVGETSTLELHKTRAFKYKPQVSSP